MSYPFTAVQVVEQDITYKQRTCALAILHRNTGIEIDEGK